MIREALIDRPIFIIGCNRSGTTLMFLNLSEHPKTWSLYEESQHVFYRHYPIHPEFGDRLVEAPPPAVAEEIERTFFREAHNKQIFGDVPVLKYIPRKLLQRQLNWTYKRAPLRLVEKTPANSLRIPFLARLFPEARFVFLIRRAEDVISSLMEGWKYWSRTGTGPWRFGNWHYLVPPGWQGYTERPLEEICAFQWVESNRIAWEDLNRHCSDRFILVRHEDAMADPYSVYREILDFCELPTSAFFRRQLAGLERRVFTHHGSEPRPAKWMQLHRGEVESVRPLFQPLQDRFYPESQPVGDAPRPG